MSICKIRLYRSDDANDLYAAARESITEVFPWLAWCHPKYSIEEAFEWSRSCEERAKQGTEYNFVIAGTNGRFLGGCGINQIHPINKYANLGYWIRSSEAGHGAAVCAVRLLADFAFQKTDLVRLEILCAVGNVRSQRVAEKAGAVREGILRDRLLLHDTLHDTIMFSIVRSQFETVEPGG